MKAKDYAFPQIRFTVEEPLSRRLLSDLVLLHDRESTRSKTMDDYCWLQWIARDLERRWKKARRS